MPRRIPHRGDSVEAEQEQPVHRLGSLQVPGEPDERLHRDHHQGGRDRRLHGETKKPDQRWHDQESSPRTDETGERSHHQALDRREDRASEREPPSPRPLACSRATPDHQHCSGEHEPREDQHDEEIARHLEGPDGRHGLRDGRQPVAPGQVDAHHGREPEGEDGLEVDLPPQEVAQPAGGGGGPDQHQRVGGGVGRIKAEEIHQDGNGQDRSPRPDDPQGGPHQKDREVSRELTHGLRCFLKNTRIASRTSGESKRGPP